MLATKTPVYSIIFLMMLLLLSCNSAKTKEARAQPGMVLIPQGEFVMGGRSDRAYQDEFPLHEVVISPFYMDLYEVTNAEFKKFVDATGYVTTAEKDIDWETIKQQLPTGTPKPPDSVLRAGSLVFESSANVSNLYDESQWWKWVVGANWRRPQGPGSSIEQIMDHPVVHVSWEDASAYADWCGKRLPTEAEWEWAASGGDSEAIYPWGNKEISAAFDQANFWQGVFPISNNKQDGYENTSPVGSFPANGFGLYDMAGNVWEWCSDRYNAAGYQEAFTKGEQMNPKGSSSYYDPREPNAAKHVLRGGSFLCNESYCSGYRITRRMSSSKETGLSHTGFRCARDLN